MLSTFHVPEGLSTGEMGRVAGLTYRQINHTASRIPTATEGRPYNQWVWSPDEVRRWQVGAALSRARTGLEVAAKASTSLIRAMTAVYAGPIPRPTRWVAISGGTVSYVDDIDDVEGMGEAILMVPMPILWPAVHPSSN